MRSHLSELQRDQLDVIARVTPYAMGAHVLNTTVLAVAVAGSIPTADLTIWCIYSYAIASVVLYRHVRGRGRVPSSFQRATVRSTAYASLLAMPWSGMAVLYLGALAQDQELILVALCVGMAASGTILLSAVPQAAFAYMSGILIPSAAKCLVFLNQRAYVLLGVLALSYWWFLAALIAKITREIGERKEAELALAERNTQLALAGKIALVGTYAVDINTGRVQLSAGCAAIHGFPEGTAEIRRSDWRAGLHPDDLERLDGLFSQAFAERWPEYKTDYRIVRSSGEVRWIDSRAFISYDGDGGAERIVGVNIDATERKRAEEHQGLLIAELDHRVKNVLASVAVVARRTSEHNVSTGDFIDALDRRIQSMADAHSLLSQNRWQGVSLADLVSRELAPYAAAGNTVVEGPYVRLTAAVTQAMAMVLHELATNAAKYGALSTPEGRVSVRWERRSNGRGPAALRLEWHEDGGPAVIAPAQPGYGTSVIRDLIPYELGGTVDLEFAPDGVRCAVVIPGEQARHRDRVANPRTELASVRS